MSDNDMDWITEALDRAEADRIAKWQLKIQPLIDAGITEAQLQVVMDFTVAELKTAAASYDALIAKVFKAFDYVQDETGKWKPA